MSITNVKELIEELQKFAPETPVGVGDSFDGAFTPISDIELVENNAESWIRMYY